MRRFDFHGSEPLMILWRALQNKIFHSYDTWPRRIISKLKVLVNDTVGTIEHEVAIKDERNIYSSKRLDSTEIPASTTKTAGLMTAWDKEKLTNIEKYIRWTDAAMPYIAGNYNFEDPFCTMTPTEVDITYKVYDLKTREYDRTIYVPGATDTTAGLMSSDFFTKVSMLPDLEDRVYWWFGYCGVDWDLDRVTYTETSLTLHYPNIGVTASDPDERATEAELTWTAVTDMKYTLDEATSSTAGLLSAENYTRLQTMWSNADRLISFTYYQDYQYKLNYYDNFSENTQAYIILNLDDVLSPIQDQIDAIEKNIDEIETSITNIENNIDSIETDISNIEGDITEINNDITSLSNTFNTSLSNLETTLNESINNLSEEIYKYINELDLGVGSVTYSASVSSGTLLGTITVDGTKYSIYAPSSSISGSDDVVSIIQENVTITPILTSGTQIASVTIGDQTTFYLYAPTSDTSGVTADELTSLVTYNAEVSSGTLLGYLVVNGEKTAIYAPTAEVADEGSTVTWSGTTKSTDDGSYEIGTLTIDGNTYTLYGVNTEGDVDPSSWGDDVWSTIYSYFVSKGIPIGIYALQEYNNDDDTYESNVRVQTSADSSWLYIAGIEGIIITADTSWVSADSSSYNSKTNPLFFKIDTDWLADWLDDNGYGVSSGSSSGDTSDAFTTAMVSRTKGDTSDNWHSYAASSYGNTFGFLSYNEYLSITGTTDTEEDDDGNTTKRIVFRFKVDEEALEETIAGNLSNYVSYSQEVTSGTLIGYLNVNGTKTEIYAPEGGTDYTLPVATASVLGGVMIGTGISVTSDGVISADVDSITQNIDWSDVDINEFNWEDFDITNIDWSKVDITELDWSEFKISYIEEVLNEWLTENVVVTQKLTSGTAIATIKVGDTTTTLYAPSSSDTTTTTTTNAFTKAVNASASGSQLESLTADEDNYSLIFEAGNGIEISSTSSDLSDSPGIVFAFTIDVDYVKDLIVVEQTLTSGTEIGTVNGVTLYAPTSLGNSLSTSSLYWTLDDTNLYAGTSTTAEYAVYATAFYESSDEKLKEDIDYVDVYEMAHRIRCGCSWSGGIPIRQFRFKDDPEHRLRYGFIAQEVEMGEPDLVTTNKDGIKSVDYNSMLSLKLAGVIGLYQQLAQQIQDTQESIGYDYTPVEDQTPLTWADKKGEHSVYKRLDKIEKDIQEIKELIAKLG